LARGQLAADRLGLLRRRQGLLEPAQIAEMVGEVGKRGRPIGPVGVGLARGQLAADRLGLLRPRQGLLEPAQIAETFG
jgi:hypothetical protein